MPDQVTRGMPHEIGEIASNQRSGTILCDLETFFHRFLTPVAAYFMAATP